MPQAAIFFTLFGIVVPTTLLAFGLVMYGMRGEPMVDNEALHMKGAART
jgi:hypothetical protein